MPFLYLQKGNRTGQIKEVIDLNQFSGFADPREQHIKPKVQSVKGMMNLLAAIWCISYQFVLDEICLVRNFV